MFYFTQEELQQEFGEKGLPRDLDAQQFELIRNRTQRFVDSYLRSAGLTTPIIDTEAIEIIKGSCLDIARYYAWSDRPSEQVKDRFEKSEKWLAQVASGKVRIVTEIQESKQSGFHNVRLIRS